MKSVISLMLIELKLLFREKESLFWSIIFPAGMMILFGFIFGSMNNGNFSVKIAIVDMDRTSVSKKFVEGFEMFDANSGQKDVPHMLNIVDVKDEKDADTLLERDKIKAIIEIPKGFSKRINAIISGEFIKLFKVKMNPANIVVKYDRSNAQTAQVVVDLVKKVTDRANEEILKSTNLYTKEEMPITLSELPVEAKEEFDYVSYLLPGVVVMAIMTTTMFGIAEDVTKLVEKEILKRMFVTPLTKGKYLLSKGMSAILISLIQLVVLFIVGIFIFDVRVTPNLLQFFLILFSGILCMFSLGFFAAAIGKTREGGSAVGNILMWPMMFFGALFFPMSGKFLTALSRVIPTTYFADGLRRTLGVYSMEIPIWQDVLWLAIWTLGFTIISAKYFRWVKR
ncbi:MAG: ABC transporter permease [Thermotogae bacterium]|nr:ABC transporter permease [Thermotogota bacterium]